MFCTLLPLLLSSPQIVGGEWDEVRRFDAVVAGRADGAVILQVPDLSGDGHPDLLSAGLGLGNGAVIMRSGLNGQLLESFSSTTDAACFYDVADMNGDGLRDVALGFPDQNPPGSPVTGLVRIYSSATGAEIMILPGFFLGEEYGSALCSVADLDSDSVDDMIITAASRVGTNGLAGVVEVYSLGTGSVLRTHEGTGSGSYGAAVMAVGDLNGDGLSDYAIGDPLAGTGQVDVHSGADGALLYSVHSPGATSAVGSKICSLSDLNGDGKGELLIQTNDGALVCSGADGALLHEFDGDVYEQDIAPAADFDLDGVDDMVLCGESSVTVASGADFSTLVTIEGEADDLFAHALGAAIDYRGEGRIEIPVGAPHTDLVQGVDTNDGSIRMWAHIPYLYAESMSISSGAGGVLRYRGTFPAGSAGYNYRLLVSITGKGPTTVNGLQVPLTVDSAAWSTWRNKYGPLQTNRGHGQLDAVGDVRIPITVNPNALAAAVGKTIYFAMVAGAPGGPLTHSSSAVPLEILP